MVARPPATPCRLPRFFRKVLPILSSRAWGPRPEVMLAWAGWRKPGGNDSGPRSPHPDVPNDKGIGARADRLSRRRFDRGGDCGNFGSFAAIDFSSLSNRSWSFFWRSFNVFNKFRFPLTTTPCLVLMFPCAGTDNIAQPFWSFARARGASRAETIHDSFEY